MPIQTELLARLTSRLTPNGASGAVADAVGVWTLLFRRFAPLVGPLSTELLFTRALALQAQVYPWLPQPHARSAGPGAFEQFVQSMDGQAPAEMLAANRALLASFIDELADLIGDGLVERFLRSVLASDGEQKNS